MGRITKIVVPIVLVASSMLSVAHAQTAEQLRQFEQLTPAQRAAIFEALEQQQSTEQVQPTEPTLVIPRDDTVIDETGGGEVRTTDSPAAQEGPVLEPFGYDLFAGQPTTFAPATDIPMPADYVIGPGDTIELLLFGNQNASYSLVVTRDGVLNFPELGPIPVSGMRFSDMQTTLQQRINEQMIGVRSSITMGPLRSIRIFLLGDAYRPGSYTVSALSTMINALFVGGGINRIGSLRNIQLKRNGQTVNTLDLYDLLLKGDTSGDARLQPGDVIFIPPVVKTVGIDGEVRRPAIYELTDERTVEDVLKLSGGLLPTAFPESSQIDRINELRERTVVDVDLSSSAGLATVVESDDVIRIHSILEKREDIVVLAGHVYREGAFQWQPGMRLTGLIGSFEDLLPQADPNYVLIRRESSNGLEIEVLSADLENALAAQGTDADVLLKQRDQVTVFSMEADRADALLPLIAELRLQSNQTTPTKLVSVTGRMKAPGLYPLEAGMRMSDLIRAGGGLGEAAYALEAELTRFSVGTAAERETTVTNINLGQILAGNKDADVTLSPYDSLHVKLIPYWRDMESVTIDGEVRFPGVYPIRRGERITSLIERAGGLTELAFAEGAIFLREELRQRERQQLAELSERLESEVAISIAANGEKSEPESTAARQALLDQLDSTTATGRLVIDLPVILGGGADTGANIALEDGDQLLIPQFSQTVTIIGEVQFPTSHVYEPNISRSMYIDKSGGISQNADKKRIYVVHASGAVAASSGSRFLGRKSTADVRPGDTIVVPLDANRISKLTLWTNITTVIYNLAVAAAAVASF